ncbi:uncharacterized protein [Periplaneta americana]|uniref:uncharacterized protein n=1 Tax=Periplaneta americana TaxID=6978 RepID=UPI0037E86140
MVEESTNFQTRFVKILKCHKDILCKSQLPESKKRKSTAMAAVREELKNEFDFSLTENQIFKKIRNMKNRIKNKVALGRTGKKSLKMKDWEKTFLELVKEETNPSLTGAPAIEVGGPVPSAENLLSEEMEHTSTRSASSTVHEPSRSEVRRKLDECESEGTREGLANGISDPVPSSENLEPEEVEHSSSSSLQESSRSEVRRKLNECETEVTRGLTLKQLQRWVMLKQLSVLEMQEELYKIQKKVLLLKKEKLLWEKRERERQSGNELRK